MRKNDRVYVIAEAGVNHNGSLDMAKKLVDAAVEAGADAVKFQTFKAEKLVSEIAPKAKYQVEATNTSESQFKMLKDLELDLYSHKILAQYCLDQSINFLSTPFDLESVQFLDKDLNISFFKVASGDVTNAPLLLRLAQTGKPIILSTGMCTLGEIEMALGVLAFGYTKTQKKPSVEAFLAAYCSKKGYKALQEKVTLLHCTTEYPAPFFDVNLLAMDTLSKAFGLRTGFSDHTEGIAVPIAAVARGASVIEKHFTLDRSLPGPDHKASLEPVSLREMVRAIRQVEQALGRPLKVPAPSELFNKPIARRSIVAEQRVTEGEMFTEKNLCIKRPGSGVSPFRFWDYLGEPAKRDYEKDEVIK